MNKTALEFLPLGLHHESAIADYLSDFADAGESRIHGYFGKPEWTHAETVRKLNAWSEGQELNGWVPSTTRFLFVNDRILGSYNFRHELTEPLMTNGGNCGYSVRPSARRKGYGTLLLANAKDFGRQLGLQRMLVTCHVENIGSARVIENNGGNREDVVFDEASGDRLARYWIEL